MKGRGTRPVHRSVRHGAARDKTGSVAMALKPFKRKKGAVEDPAAVQREIDTVLRVLAQYPPATRISFGAPVRCPSCANFGLVEHVNSAAGVSYNHCVGCGLDWIITVRALRAARETVAASFG